jgi:hypothetical protein
VSLNYSFVFMVLGRLRQLIGLHVIAIEGALDMVCECMVSVGWLCVTRRIM